MELQKLSTLTHNDFKDFLDKSFDIQFEPTVTLPAQLVELIALNGYSPLERKPFSIIFRTKQKNEYYPQSTYIIIHPLLGDIPMFLSPKGYDSEGMKYEAVFS
ncbi:DUF6916 family protein [Lacihabitans soyangensis]|uniref:DUF6916 domain-containing protein n=1 Tax=Lacihabitans soyangensis TaxID=869394 RepID=A0AAE3KSN2_9BACT|nr:hypothetical protein [Lacihabitans soyangensis]MCP9763283.1 hypothetical protein [Lacihabitans soyangensis]